MRRPIDDFIVIKNKIIEIGQTRDIEVLFKELSESLAIVENDILTDNVSDNFKEDLASLIINYLTLLSLKYNIDDLYSFLLSRSHWGVYDEDHFKNIKKALVEPYYKMRIEVSSLIVKKNKGLSVKPLFDLSAYLIFLEEKDEE